MRGVGRWPARVWDLLAAVGGVTLLGLGTWQIWGGAAATLVIGGILLLGAVWSGRRAH
jgi:hypothetical protein